MLKRLRQYSIIQHKQALSYAQENHIITPILKYPSVFVVLGVRLTKYQQIHPDIAPAVQQMFTSLFTYLLEPL